MLTQSEQLTRLTETLLDTGMMNELFIEQIRAGDVDRSYVQAAFENLRRSLDVALLVEKRLALCLLFDDSNVLLTFNSKIAEPEVAAIATELLDDDERPIEAAWRAFSGATRVSQAQAAEHFEWSFVGKFGRPALADHQPQSFETYVYAAKVQDVREFMPVVRQHFTRQLKLEFSLETGNEPELLFMGQSLGAAYGTDDNPMTWLIPAAQHSLKTGMIFDGKLPILVDEHLLEIKNG